MITSLVFEGTLMFSFSNNFFSLLFNLILPFLVKVFHSLLPIPCGTGLQTLQQPGWTTALQVPDWCLHSEILAYLHQDIFFRLMGGIVA